MKVLSQFEFLEYLVHRYLTLQTWCSLFILSSAKFRLMFPMDFIRYSGMSFLWLTVTLMNDVVYEASCRLCMRLAFQDACLGLTAWLVWSYSPSRRLVGAILLLGFLLGARFVQRLSHVRGGGLFGHSLLPLMPTNSA